jgi:hypothetical protein
MRPFGGILAFGTLLALAGSCARYQWVPVGEQPECRNRKPTPPAGIIAIVNSNRSAAGASLVGRVSEQSTGRSIPGAQVILERGERTTANSDTAGRFVVTGVPSGRYRVTVRSLGFEVPSDSISLPLPDSSEVDVQLVVATINDGGCDGFAMVRVRKPWWRIW